MITEHPLERPPREQSGYEPFWAAAALEMPVSLHTATRPQGRIRGAGDKALRGASGHATWVYPSPSMGEGLGGGERCRSERAGIRISSWR